MSEIDSLSPSSGRIVNEDGTTSNVVDLLGGDTSVSDKVYDIDKYAAKSGRVIGEDGKVYSMVDMLSSIGGGLTPEQLSQLNKNTSEVAELKDDLSELSNHFNTTLLEKCVVIGGKNVNKASSYYFFDDVNSYLLLVPQSEFIYLSVETSEIANDNNFVMYTDYNLELRSGTSVNSDYNCIVRREPDKYEYVAIPYYIENKNPSIRALETTIYNNDNIKDEYVPEALKNMTKRNGNLVDLDKSFIDYRSLYGLIYKNDGFLVSNLFDIDISEKYYMNGYVNNSSNAKIVLFDDTFTQLGELAITDLASYEKKCFDYNDTSAKVFSFDLSDNTEYASAKYAFVAMKYNVDEKFIVDNFFVSKSKPMVSTTKEELYQIKPENSVMLNNTYYGKYFSAIGDSITAQGFYERYVRDELHLAGYVCNGIGGTKISGSDEKSMWQDVRINDIADVDLITICGGINDCGQDVEIGEASIENCDTNTFIGAYNVLLSKLYYRFLKLNSGYYSSIDYSGVEHLDDVINVKIVLCTPPKIFDNANAYNNESKFAEAVRVVGELWGLPVADLYGKMNVNDMNKTMYYSETDRTHPNKDGHKMIADIIVGTLKNIAYFSIEE